MNEIQRTKNLEFYLLPAEASLYTGEEHCTLSGLAAHRAMKKN